MFCLRLIILATLTALGLLSACSEADIGALDVPGPTPTPVEAPDHPAPTPTPVPEVGPIQNGKVSFKGVTLTVAIPGVTGVQPSLEPSYVLTDPTFKPDGVEPRNIKFAFFGPYADRDTFYSPLIQIFPVDEYREAWSIEPHYVKTFDEDMKLLKNVIAGRSGSVEGLPGLSPYCDCSVDLTCHVKIISFKNGRGVLYLAHFSIEDDLVRNHSLTYVFQGFTADEKYYVFGAFPVRSSLLSDEYGDDNNVHLGYSLPATLSGDDWEQKRAGYNLYLAKARTLLARQKPDHFKPDLNSIERAVSSLEVNW